MLRGEAPFTWHAAALAAIGAVVLVLSWALLRRGMTRV